MIATYRLAEQTAGKSDRDDATASVQEIVQ